MNADRATTAVSWLALAAALALAAGCAGPGASRDDIARAGGLVPFTLSGAPFQHRAYARVADASQSTWVFIEGDGRPWSASGRRRTSDPDPRRWLALELAAQTPGNVLYLGRPCYLGSAALPPCTAFRLDRCARYSSTVVDSLAAAIENFRHERAPGPVVLVGYSGGGVLAVLLGPRVPATTAILTIAANLDVDSWTAWHHYAPLAGSENPLTLVARSPTVPLEQHLVGTRDAVVPPRLNANYFAHLAPAQVTVFESFDHVCCWVERWPEILRAEQARLSQPRADGAQRP